MPSYSTVLKRALKLEGAALRHSASSSKKSQSALATLLNPLAAPESRTIASIHIRGPLDTDSLWSIVRLLDDDDERVAWDGAAVLGRLRSRRATRMLLPLLARKGNLHRKKAAIHVLQRLRDARSIGGLMRVAAFEQDDELRAMACDALGSFARRRRVRELLLKGLGDSSSNVRVCCLLSLLPVRTLQRVREAVDALRHDRSSSWYGEVVGDIAASVLEE